MNRLKAILAQPAWILALFQLAIAVSYSINIIGPTIYYVLGVIGCAVFVEIGRRRKFPFLQSGSLKTAIPNITNYFINFGLSLAPLNALTRETVLLPWYPTQNHFWGLVPFVILAVLGLRFGIGRLGYGTKDND